MSVEAMALVLNHSVAKGTRKLVLLGIANHEGDGGAYPAMATLARYAGVDERNARRAVEWLRDHHELAVEVQGGGDRDVPDYKRTNRYRVLVSCPPWCDRTTQHRDTRKLAGPQLTVVDNYGDPGAVAPGGLSTGGAPAPGEGGAVAPPKPSPKHHPTPASAQLQDTRACQVCAQPAGKCIPQQLAYPPEDRHTYRPVPRR